MNSLLGRLTRAVYRSIKNGAWLPLYLSPWGDRYSYLAHWLCLRSLIQAVRCSRSSPFELPYIRKRDLVLLPLLAPLELGDMVLGTFPSLEDDPYCSEIINVAGDESMVEAGLGHHYIARLPLEMPSWHPDTVRVRRISALVLRYFPSLTSIRPSGSICTLRVRILHRFVDEVAQIRFHGERETSSILDSALNSSKGWFAPYLHATNRCPYIPRFPFFPRTTQPDVVVIEGPSLFCHGDYALAVRCLKPLIFVDAFN